MPLHISKNMSIGDYHIKSQDYVTNVYFGDIHIAQYIQGRWTYRDLKYDLPAYIQTEVKLLKYDKDVIREKVKDEKAKAIKAAIDASKK